MHARDEVLQLPGRDPRRGGRATSTTSVDPTATPTTRGAGPRPATPRSSGTSRTPTRAGCTSRSSCTGPTGSAIGGGLRDQFHHVNDIVPTIYETPRRRGARRLPRRASSSRSPGCRWRYTFDAPDAPSTEARAVLRDDGSPGDLRRRVEGGDPPPAGRPLRRRRLGALPPRPRTAPSATTWPRSMPEKVGELVALWWEEAEDATASSPSTTGPSSCSAPATATTPPIPSTATTPTSRRCRRFPAQVAPALGGRGWDMTATIDRPAGDSAGALRLGHRELGPQPLRPGRPSGPRLQLLRRPPVVVSERGCPVGPSEVGVRFRRNGQSWRGHPGASTGRRPDRWNVPFAMTIISSVGPSVGYDHGSAVSERYRGPFPLRGQVPPTRRRAAPTGGSRRCGRRGRARPVGGALGDVPAVR